MRRAGYPRGCRWAKFVFALLAADIAAAKQTGADPAQDDGEGEHDYHDYPLPMI